MANKSRKDIVHERIQQAERNNSNELRLGEIGLEAIPKEVFELENLEVLKLYANLITTIPNEIKKLKKLKKIDISNNPLQTFPAAIFGLNSLEVFTARDNKFADLPEEIDHLENLKELNLTSNQLKMLPETIGQLKKLEILRLNSNQIHTLPSKIKHLGNLKLLNINSNKLSNLPKEFYDLVGLTDLSLAVNSILEFSQDIENLIDLVQIEVGGNQLVELPREIGKLKKLQRINASNNRIGNLPSEIGQLSQLRRLELGRNLIGNIPGEVELLSELVSLALSNNLLTSIPDEIGQLHELYNLDLRSNQLITIPSSIGALKKLQLLDLRSNNLTSLPDEIGNLPNLINLYLDNNHLTSLPHTVKNLKSLEKITLNGNNLSIPPEIISENEKSPSALFNFIFRSNHIPLVQAKTLFIGQGSVGKTSLIYRITNGIYNIDQTKTEGINISSWQVNNQSQYKNEYSKIKLNIWDFGGQEIMHATHQFFLTKRSLYLLVLDSRLTQEENRVEYWLKIIQSFGGESPVLIVGNKIDQHPLDIDRTGLQKKYPNIVGILETSAATGAGIEELKAAIAEQVNNLPHVRDLLPETWFTVKTKLEELGKQSNFITHDKYLELCAENEVSDETSQRTLIGFLHDLGVVLHFQDDPRLEALGILNPQWVTNGVYKILNSHTLFQNKGVLTVSMLDEILNLPEYPRGKRLFIVDMMKKFELCYDIEPDKTFLVPDLLPKDEPATDGRENALAFQYHYAVLPSIVITRFIVRMNEYAQEKVWRSGVVLKNGGNTALIKADIEDRKIFIWVSGDNHIRHDFLSKIRGQFDAIHKTISKLEVKEMVPVPNHPEADPVDYDLLLQMDHNNVEVYPVLSDGKMIVANVRTMLNGVAREADRQRRNVTNFYIGGDVKDSTIIAGDENEVKK